jgi:hypothetical protein
MTLKKKCQKSLNVKGTQKKALLKTYLQPTILISKKEAFRYPDNKEI